MKNVEGITDAVADVVKAFSRRGCALLVERRNLSLSLSHVCFAKRKRKYHRVDIVAITGK